MYNEVPSNGNCRNSHKMREPLPYHIWKKYRDNQKQLKRRKEEIMSEKKKINWLGLLLEVVKVVGAFLLGSEM